jgi:predicted permease
MSDFKLSWRQFRKAPVSVLSCIAVLAIGLAGVTTVFSALYAVALRPLPYLNPKQLVAVHSQFPRLQMDRLGVSPPDYRDLARQRDLFRDVGAFFYLDLSRSGVTHAEKVNAIAVSRSLFDTLGVRPAFGRVFLPEEERPGGQHVVLLSDSYWRGAFGADPHVLRRTMRLNGEMYSVIGVMPRSFVFPNEVTQMWVPVVFKPGWMEHLGRQNVFLHMYARIADGVTFDDAVKKLDRISKEAAIRNRADYTVDLTGWKYFLVPLAKEDRLPLQSWTWVLFWSVLVLFAIVCVNVSGLLVLRTMQRAFEVSVRLALGGRLRDIARQLMVEIGFICATGAMAGSVIALAAVHWLNVRGPFGALRISLPVLGFGLVLTAVAGMACLAYPLWKASRSSPVDAMNAGGHQRTEPHSRQFARRTLVVIQVAASTALLAIGALMWQSYTRLLQVPLGFEAKGVMSMQISLPPLRYASEASRRAFYETVLDRLRHVPGISYASACTIPPFGYGENVQPFSIPGRSSNSGQELAIVNDIWPDFFATLRIPLLTGRVFDGHSESGAIVDETLARRYFPHESALGKRIQMGERWLSIQSVVGNIKVAGLDAQDLPTIYLNAVQTPVTDMAILVKSTRALNSVPQLVQGIVSEIDREQPVYDFASLENRVEASLATRRFVTLLLACFAMVGIVITGIGLYGVLSYSVLVRRREFGIMSAVGAAPLDLSWLIFKQGTVLIVIGATCGIVLAFAVSRLVAEQLYGIQLDDARAWWSMAGVLFGAGLLACLGPAWRAGRVNTLAILKQD